MAAYWVQIATAECGFDASRDERWFREWRDGGGITVDGARDVDDAVHIAIRESGMGYLGVRRACEEMNANERLYICNGTATSLSAHRID